MTDHQSTNPYHGGRVYRIVWGAAGVLIAVLGIYVVFHGVVGLPVRIGAGVILTLLGADAIWAALQSKQSWLAEIVLFI